MNQSSFVSDKSTVFDKLSVGSFFSYNGFCGLGTVIYKKVAPSIAEDVDTKVQHFVHKSSPVVSFIISK